jgi:hypothetical protein
MWLIAKQAIALMLFDMTLDVNTERRASTEIAIDEPISDVFDLLTTSRYWPEWHPATVSVAGVTDRPLRIGDEIHERAVIGGRLHEGTWTVTERRRPTRLTLQIDDGRIQVDYTLRSLGTETLFRRELRYRPQDFAGGTADPQALQARMHEQSTEALHRLKALVERQLPLERTKLLSRRILERVFNERDYSALDECFTPDASIHDPGEDFRGPAELRGGLQNLFIALPDFHFSVEEQIAEGDRVVVRYRGTGTHGGEMYGHAGTGRRIDYSGVLLLQFEGERIARFWAQPDQLGVAKQIGLGLTMPAA